MAYIYVGPIYWPAGFNWATEGQQSYNTLTFFLARFNSATPNPCPIWPNKSVAKLNDFTVQCMLRSRVTRLLTTSFLYRPRRTAKPCSLSRHPQKLQFLSWCKKIFVLLNGYFFSGTAFPLRQVSHICRQMLPYNHCETYFSLRGSPPDQTPRTVGKRPTYI